MNVMRVTCHYCNGIGHHRTWEVVSEGMLEARDKVCSSCGGKGYTEHAVFSVEEAEAILKHCGLSKEV